MASFACPRRPSGLPKMAACPLCPPQLKMAAPHGSIRHGGRSGPSRPRPEAIETRVLRGGRKGRKRRSGRPEVAARLLRALHVGQRRLRHGGARAGAAPGRAAGARQRPRAAGHRPPPRGLRRPPDPRPPQPPAHRLPPAPGAANAAVLLRRRLLGRWSRLDPALRQRLPALLAEALERETEHPVTVALAQLAALVLRRGGLGAWGPLGTWLQAGARDPRPPRQEAALLVLSAAVEAAPEALAPHGPPLAALCRGLLGPTAAPGPTAYSLRALGGLAAMLGDGHTELLRSLLPDVLGGVEKLLDADEALATEALEVLDEFLEADPAAVTPHLRPLLDLCLQVGGAATRGDAVRARALATIAFVAQRCPKALLRGGLLPPLLRGLLGPLCAAPPPGRPDPEDEEDEDEEEEEGGEAEGSGGPSPRHAAAQALDALAQALPPEKLLRPLLPLLEPLLGSPRPPARKGGLLALGALAEGCGEHLRRRYLGPALRVLRGGLGDPEASVRGAAACALRRLADCLQPEVATLAGEMLPTALAALEGPGVREAPAKAWYILESLLECLGEDVAPFLPAVLRVLLGVLDPPGPPRSLELALSSLCTLASGAGEQLQPHAGPILAALSPLLRPGPPESRPRRLQALEVLGALGPGAGRQLVPALELGLELALEEDEPEGRRVLYGLAAAAAAALGDGLGPLLPRVVPLLLGALRRPPAPAAPAAPDSFLLFEDGDDADEGAEPMEEDGEEEEELLEVEVGGAYAQELEEACEALGEVAEHCGAAFLPYVEPSLEAMLELLQFPQAGVRGAAYTSLGCLCVGLYPPGDPGPHHDPARQAAAGRAAGPWPGGGGRAGAGGGGGALGALGRAEAAAEVRELAGEVLVALAEAVGGELAPHLDELLPLLLARLEPRCSVGERSWAAATLAGVGGALGVASAPLLPRLVPALGAAAGGDAHPEVRANALHALGRLAAAAGPALGPYPPHGHAPSGGEDTPPSGDRPRPFRQGAGLRALLGAAAAREGPGRVRDNACGALARLGGALPPPEAGLVLPLLLPALPLAEDWEEEPAVLGFLLGLRGSQFELLAEHTGELVRVCGSIVGNPRLSPEAEAGLRALLGEVAAGRPEAAGEALARLPPDAAARLRHALRWPRPPYSRTPPDTPKVQPHAPQLQPRHPRYSRAPQKGTRTPPKRDQTSPDTPKVQSDAPDTPKVQPHAPKGNQTPPDTPKVQSDAPDTPKVQPHAPKGNQTPPDTPKVQSDAPKRQPDTPRYPQSTVGRPRYPQSTAATPPLQPRAPKGHPHTPKARPDVPRYPQSTAGRPQIPSKYSRTSPGTPKVQPHAPQLQPRHPRYSRPPRKGTRTPPKCDHTSPDTPKVQPHAPRYPQSTAARPQIPPKYSRTPPDTPKVQPDTPELQPRAPRVQPRAPKGNQTPPNYNPAPPRYSRTPPKYSRMPPNSNQTAPGTPELQPDTPNYSRTPPNYSCAPPKGNQNPQIPPKYSRTPPTTAPHSYSAARHP
ncbi:importin-4-like [Dromaius novaehollandiae]|uniref:importin-4-like n=1 Tax=Dromaius novaehollandiae TaxID=8790 RepID=UPI00311E3D97